MKIIDTHIHGAFGVNFNTSSYEEIKSLLKEFYKRDIAGICPTLVGDNSDNIYNRLQLFKKIKEENTPKHCCILGVHLEGTFLNPQKPGIQNPATFMRPNTENFKKIVKDMQDIVKIVTLAPELDENNKLSIYLENNNIRAHSGHTAGTHLGYTTGTTHHFNAMPPISHRGSNIALDALLDDNVYCEIIADMVHVDKNMLELFFKVKNNSKIILVSDALPAAHCKDGVDFCAKKINKNGKDEKGTIAGSVLLLDEIIANAINNGVITLQQAKKFAYDNPLEHLDLTSDELSVIEKI